MLVLEFHANMLGLLCVILVGLSQAEQVRYDRFQVWTINPRTVDDVTNVMALVNDKTMKLKLWHEPRGLRPFDVMVDPTMALAFSESLAYDATPYTVAVEDVQRLIDDTEAQRAETRVTKEQDPVNYILSDYQRHSTINTWINDMASQYSQASVRSVGTSYEGRDMRAITISSGSGRPAIVIDCGIHAREWISPSTCIYAIKNLLERYDSDNNVRQMVDRYDWHFLPVANPDGYEYTHTSDRMWRKNRAPTNDWLCPAGIDLNRNFDIFWGEAGVSFDPCDDTYPGTRGFSEVETQAIRDWINGISNKKLYLNIHSYTQLWLTPWGYNPNERYPADYAEIERVGIAAMDALEAVNGRSFVVGTPPDILYEAAGGAYDWAKAVGGVPYSYAPELRPATAGEGGFILDASNITPAGAEVFEALRVHSEQMQ
ncbi:unnamed protein product [Owenia fusiformis]|uniref:Peptidase M14 domain-containing protein n=1 Tax=Owenia fusiformis TaxID=6347 RepID=A0A8J1UAL7_OWEFU|nr:unnamed protein product [Owenia fusiformis]